MFIDVTHKNFLISQTKSQR